MAQAQRKHLLVEGNDDLYAIVSLMQHHIAWGDTKLTRPVQIRQCGGIENILDADYIATLLMSRETEILGIVVDADDNFSGRWQQLKSICQPHFSDMNSDIPAEGMIINNEDGKRIGIWIMPDNSSIGMLETFLKYLVPTENENILALAESSVAQAKESGASFSISHLEKANLYTWLAWQNPPGQSLGTALLHKTLDAKSQAGNSFVQWFCRLYDLDIT